MKVSIWTVFLSPASFLSDPVSLASYSLSLEPRSIVNDFTFWLIFVLFCSFTVANPTLACFNEETTGGQRKMRISVNFLHQLMIFSGCKDCNLHWSAKPNAVLNLVKEEIKSKNLLQQHTTSNCFYFLIARRLSIELTCQKARRK